MTLANRITLIRALLAIVMFACILMGGFIAKLAAFVVFIIAAISDWIDGKIARKTNTTTIFGAIADPFVDKILVIAAFLAFAAVRKLNIPLWAVFLILTRELAISTLRVLAAAKGQLLSAERSGKFKTAIQFISVILIFIVLNMQALAPSYELARKISFITKDFPYVLTVIVAVITLFSGISYVKNHWKLLTSTWSAGKNNE